MRVFSIFSIIMCLLLLLPVLAGSQDLSVTSSDLRIEQTIEGGYYLFVRKKAAIESVLLTESTEDPNFELASYALRNPEYHYENGDELRILNGDILLTEGLYSLIDSTVVNDEQFGLAFKIFIPYVVEFGYEDGRNGELQVLDGTYLSVRAFELPYADYRGAYEDNPFIIRVTQRPSPPVAERAEPVEPEPEQTEPIPEPLPGEPEAVEEPDLSRFMEDTVESFSSISESTDGKILFSDGEEDILNKIRDILSDETGSALDLVIALDSTESMGNDMPWLRENLGRIIEESTTGFSEIRIGFVYYRDYLEEYLYRISRFEPGVERVSYILNRINPRGGRDIPEAVNEALYAALTEFVWMADNKKIILIGDAPPHPRPRGNVTSQMVAEEARRQGIAIHSIILPH